mgnify:CR=1 FL=1
MNAVRFIEERNRMCKAYCGCSKCPAYSNGSCKFSITRGCEADKQVEIVKEWSAAHPRKTRQSVFLEQWPNCTKDATGVINLCPRYFDTGYICSGTGMDCAKCRSKFWGKVVG